MGSTRRGGEEAAGQFLTLDRPPHDVASVPLASCDHLQCCYPVLELCSSLKTMECNGWCEAEFWLSRATPFVYRCSDGLPDYVDKSWVMDRGNGVLCYPGVGNAESICICNTNKCSMSKPSPPPTRGSAPSGKTVHTMLSLLVLVFYVTVTLN